jgi:hypothetical protein
MTYQGRKLYTPAKYQMRVKGTLEGYPFMIAQFARAYLRIS